MGKQQKYFLTDFDFCFSKAAQIFKIQIFITEFVV